MSVLGVILGIVGIIAALLSAVLGIIGGIPAIILGLLAVLFGCLARRNRRGIPSIVIGVLVIVLAVALTFSGINSAKYYLNQVKANPEKAPVLARYADHVRLEYGFLGYLVVTRESKPCLKAQAGVIPLQRQLLWKKSRCLLKGCMTDTGFLFPDNAEALASVRVLFFIPKYIYLFSISLYICLISFCFLPCMHAGLSMSLHRLSTYCNDRNHLPPGVPSTLISD